MIQRIQTIFLALVVIIGVFFSYSPFLLFVAGDVEYIMNAYKTTFVNAESVEVLSNNMGVGVMQGLVFLTTLIAIFIYKNRSLQIKLCKLNILLIALQIAAVVMYSDVVRAAIDVEDIAIKFQFAAVIPVISLILTYLAIRFIKKDDALVRSADRLR